MGRPMDHRNRLRADVRRLRPSRSHRSVTGLTRRMFADGSRPVVGRLLPLLVVIVASLKMLAAGGRLQAHRLAPPATVTAGLIVGRASCSDRAWLLTDGNHLIGIAQP